MKLTAKQLGDLGRLTGRSTGAPTAGHQARAAPWFIMHRAGLASIRRRPVNSALGNAMTEDPKVVEPYEAMRRSVDALRTEVFSLSNEKSLRRALR
jgi:hypothetical protein